MSVHLPAKVQTGTAVPIELHLANVSDRTLTLNLQGREIAFDIIVTTADGKPVWRRLEHQTLQAILRMETLEPGQVLRLQTAWTAARSGAYLVSGVIPTDGAPLQARPQPLRVY